MKEYDLFNKYKYGDGMGFKNGTKFYVDGINGNNDYDGLSWDSAFKTIQKAVDSTGNGRGDIIFVASIVFRNSSSILLISELNIDDKLKLYKENEFEIRSNNGYLIFYANEKNPKNIESLCKDKRENRCICKRCYKIYLFFDEYYNREI
jgi:hypothetical protein